MQSERITLEQLRADACKARAWASLNGSSADALKAGSRETYRIAGDPGATRARLPYSRGMIARMTDARLRELRA